jgi:hypothetical protein
MTAQLNLTFEQLSLNETKGFYDNDRKNLYELDADPLIETLKLQAESIACLVNENYLVENKPMNQFQLSPAVQNLAQKIHARYGMPYGEGQPFYEEPSLGFGTMFLVSSRTALTAAHCVCLENSDRLDQTRIKATRVVFGWQMIQANEYKKTFHTNEVFLINRVIFCSFTRGATCTDWAWVELDRDVEGRAPLTIDFSSMLKLNTPVYLIGHSNGIPLKYSNGSIKKAGHLDHFDCNFAAFKGHSGSPVFSEKNLKVIGILFSGNDDYQLDTNYKGTRQSRYIVKQTTEYEIEQFGYEKCQRLNNHPLKPEINRQLKITEQREGLNLKGRCTNEGCSTFGHEIFIHKQFGHFNIGKELCISKCPYCAQTVKAISTIFLKECIYSYEGAKEKETIKTPSQKTQQHSITLAENWNYFEIKTEQLT